VWSVGSPEMAEGGGEGSGDWPLPQTYIVPYGLYLWVSFLSLDN